MPRIVVNPGDPVISSWGNTVFDQSVQSFSNPAQRDSQWPTPLDGSMAYTTDTGTLWVRRAGVWKALPLGHLASATGPPAQTDYTALATAVTVTVPVTIGRRYRISGYVYGVQQAAGTLVARIRDDQLVDNFMYNGPLGAAAAIPSTTAVLSYLAAATRTATWSVMLNGAGAFRLAANAAQITVEDIGF